MPPLPPPVPTTASFDAVLAQELDDIATRRQLTHNDAGNNAAANDPRGKALQMDLVGLALSGGGIRSATFALGVLQGLARLRMLGTIDYLSSVSGGGYIASWFAAWVKRDGDLGRVESQLSPNRVDQQTFPRPAIQRADWQGSDPEPAPVAHLRAHGSYLTPWRGLFTADTWTLFAIYFRNLLVNLAILVPAAAFLALLPRWAVWAFWQGGYSPANTPDNWPDWAHDVGSWLLAVVMLGALALALWPRPGPTIDPATGTPTDGSSNRADLMGGSLLLVGLILSVLLLVCSGEWDHATWDVGIAGVLFALVASWWILAKSLPVKQRVRPAVWFLLRVLVPIALAALFAVWFRWHADARPCWLNASAILALVVFAVAFVFAGANLVLGPSPTPESSPWYRRFHTGLLCPLVVAALLAGWVFGLDPTSEGWPDTAAMSQRHPGYARVQEFRETHSLSMPSWLLYAAPSGSLGVVLGLIAGGRRWGLGHRWTWKLVLANGLAGAFAGLGLYLILQYFVWEYWYRPRLLATFALPLALAVLGTVGYIQVAIVGQAFDDHEREWRSRLGGRLMMIACVWMGLFAVTLYLPGLVRDLAAERWGKAVNLTAIASWLATTAAGAIFSRSPANETGPSALVRRILVRVAPAVFLIGLFAVVSRGLDVLILGDTPDELTKAHMPIDPARSQEITPEMIADPNPEVSAFLWKELNARKRVEFDTTPLVWTTFATFALAALLLGVIDVNVFSLHAMYANRLTRCYLGATRQRHPAAWPGVPIHSQPATVRRDDPVTGMDADDDLPLSDLRMNTPTPAQTRPRSALPYRGPLLLVNTALNVVGGTDLSLRDRKAISFSLSARHCGSPQTGYACTPTDEADAWNLTLGRALAISGAAVDPNMANYQSAALTAFLTVLNARLGYWIENPNRATVAEPWRAMGPAFGSFLLTELLGQTDAKGEFVHLSDGGHFDNTGAYELVRRRCRYIILCDAGTDHGDASENLANLIRLCHVDFGVRIEIDTTPLRKGEGGLSRWHCAVGRIRYDEVDHQGVAGTLVFLRVSLTGDEPADIRQYARENPEFPHQSTLDQFFDDQQLESYRGLGYHIATEAFAEAADWFRQRRNAPQPEPYRESIRGMFARVRHRWFPPPPGFTEHFEEAAKGCLDLIDTLRSNTALANFRQELYPEAGANADAELLTVNQMLSIMELAWMGVHLDGYFAHSFNRGWMDAMHRWTATPTFQKHWPLLRAEYSKDFVRFCERALCVQPIPPKVVQWTATSATALQGAVPILSREFGLEFVPEILRVLHGVASNLAPGAFLDAWIAQVVTAAGNNAIPLWFITLGQPGQASVIQSNWSADDYPCGVVLIRELQPVPPRPARLELFFWMRGAHRSLGLGRAVWEALRPAIRTLYPGRELVARFPIAGTSSGARLQRAMWMNFFHDFDFRQEQSPGPNERLLELVWRVR